MMISSVASFRWHLLMICFAPLLAHILRSFVLCVSRVQLDNLQNTAAQRPCLQ